MPWKLMIRTAAILAIGQGLLGAVGFFFRSRSLYGLPMALLLTLFILRVARILRHELAKAERKTDSVVPFDVAMIAAALWQIPTALAAPVWAPAWVSEAWFGAYLSVPWYLKLLPPGDMYRAAPFQGFLFCTEMALFVFAAMWGRRTAALRPPQIVTPGGEVAIVRRFEQAILEREERESQKAGHP